MRCGRSIDRSLPGCGRSIYRPLPRCNDTPAYLACSRRTAWRGIRMATDPRQEATPPTLRRLLSENRIVAGVGVHDALGGVLAEKAGFDFVWASGFSIAASMALPDANLLGMEVQLDRSSQIASAIRIPVLADCDTGYGNAINAIRAVREFERRGVAGICIEDAEAPKRCSFYSQTRRGLAPLRSMRSRYSHALRIGAAATSVLWRGPRP